MLRKKNKFLSNTCFVGKFERGEINFDHYNGKQKKDEELINYIVGRLEAAEKFSKRNNITLMVATTTTKQNNTEDALVICGFRRLFYPTYLEPYGIFQNWKPKSNFTAHKLSLWVKEIV